MKSYFPFDRRSNYDYVKYKINFKRIDSSFSVGFGRSNSGNSSQAEKKVIKINE